MSARVGIYEEDGVEYGIAVEKDLIPLIYKEGLTCLNSLNTTVLEINNTTWTSLGLSISPPAGKYLAFFNGSVMAEGAGSTVAKVRLVVGGSEVSGSLRETRNTVIMLLGLIGGNSVDGGASNIIMPITVTSGQSVDIQGALGGTGTRVTAKNRTLTLLRIG